MSENYINNSVGFLINGIKQKMKRRMSEKLKNCGLTTEQRNIILIVCEYGAMTQSKLCELAGMEPSNLTITLKRLAVKELIKKVDHPTDSRAYLVDVTEKAKNIQPELQGLSAQISGPLLDGIDKDDMVVTMKTLKRMYENLS
jgi:DNA-binding MarR family transcriptional regulator